MKPSDVQASGIEPFHGSARVEPGARRLLLISYHFPPSPEVGALRWQRLAAYGVERGWGIDVVTRSPAALGTCDMQTLDALPANLRVFGVPEVPSPLARLEQEALRILRSLGRRPVKAPVAGLNHGGSGGLPGSLRRSEIHWLPLTPRSVMRTYHAWSLFISTRHWGGLAARLARRLIGSGSHAAVITCGPPHQVHEAGRRLALRYGLPHVVDLRDPWSLQERVLEGKASPVYYILEGRDERRVMARAALVISNTGPATAALRAAYPEAPGRFLTIRNGYDIEPAPSAARRDKFIMAYAGSIYYDRTPRGLFRAVKRLVKSESLTRADLGMLFVGNVERFEDISLEQMAREEGVSEFLILLPRIARHELSRVLEDATILVSLPQDSHMAIPSKIYEYMSFHAALLAMADERSATAELLQGTSADVVPPDDIDRLAEVLIRRYHEFRRGVVPQPVARDRTLSRGHQARILFDALQEVAGSP